MFLRKRSASVKYFIAALFGVIVYNEWFIYFMQPMFWHDMKFASSDKTVTKIMFIADPQIQGEMAVPPPLSYLFNWDSDRYLRTTFRIAIKTFKPDILVYLGDLMDEGSISSKAQFHSYVKRLSNIFEVPYPIIQIWLPGDNDIGGENEPIKRDKIKEFNEVFHQPTVISYKNVTFFKVNGITNSIPRAPKENISYRIVISHYPTLVRSIFSSKMNEAIRPDVCFCAHEHKSKYVLKDKELKKYIETRVMRPGDEILNVISDEDELYEIYVPTCSYRMGTDSIGYGAAVLIENNKLMRYTVFWSPRRFPSLFVYAGFLTVSVVYVLIYCLSRMIFKCTPAVNTDATEPLLRIN